MARPREFEEDAVLDAAMECFWNRGYEATSMRDLVEKTGITGASLYNAFGDKRALYERALDRYVEGSVADRMKRCEQLPPREAIAAFQHHHTSPTSKMSFMRCEMMICATLWRLSSSMDSNLLSSRGRNSCFVVP